MRIVLSIVALAIAASSGALASSTPSEWLPILDRAQKIRLVTDWRKRSEILEVRFQQNQADVTIDVVTHRGTSRDKAKIFAQTLLWQVKSLGYDTPPPAGTADNRRLGVGKYHYTVNVKTADEKLIEMAVKRADADVISWSLEEGEALIRAQKQQKKQATTEAAPQRRTHKPWWQRSRTPKAWDATPDTNADMSR